MKKEPIFKVGDEVIIKKLIDCEDSVGNAEYWYSSAIHPSAWYQLKKGVIVEVELDNFIEEADCYPIAVEFEDGNLNWFVESNIVEYDTIIVELENTDNTSVTSRPYPKLKQGDKVKTKNGNIFKVHKVWWVDEYKCYEVELYKVDSLDLQPYYSSEDAMELIKPDKDVEIDLSMDFPEFPKFRVGQKLTLKNPKERDVWLPADKFPEGTTVRVTGYNKYNKEKNCFIVTIQHCEYTQYKGYTTAEKDFQEYDNLKYFEPGNYVTLISTNHSYRIEGIRCNDKGMKVEISPYRDKHNPEDFYEFTKPHKFKVGDIIRNTKLHQAKRKVIAYKNFFKAKNCYEMTTEIVSDTYQNGMQGLDYEVNYELDPDALTLSNSSGNNWTISIDPAKGIIKYSDEPAKLTSSNDKSKLAMILLSEHKVEEPPRKKHFDVGMVVRIKNKYL